MKLPPPRNDSRRIRENVQSAKPLQSPSETARMDTMMTRNAHLGRQLRAALRASRWGAGVLAFRAGVSREMMARVLVGDSDVSLGVYELVAEQLEVNLGLAPWRAAGSAPAPGRAIETVVDRAQQRLKARKLTDLRGILQPPPGVGRISLDDLSR